ncbi:MAG: efflux RND transporter periplasmic adaptor subunit [bacterium]|nr:efflux RND transporter periplasmic adaptor subunit [bacterium]
MMYTSCLRLLDSRFGHCVVLLFILGLSQQLWADQGIEVENAILKTIEATKVAAEVEGRIAELSVREGQRVEQNQKLGRIRDDAVRLQLENRRLELAVARRKQDSDIDLRLAQKRSEVASLEFERAVDANRRLENTYPPKEIDRLGLVARSAELEIERAALEQELRDFEVLQAENAVLQAEELLSRHAISAPADGVVVSVEFRNGEWLKPGDEIFTIVKIDRLRIEGFVSSESASRELLNRPAAVSIASGNRIEEVRGSVVFVSPDTNPVNGLVRVFLEIDNRDGRYRPGMRVRAVIGIADE